MINYLLRKFQKSGKYLEIGCDLNQTFSKIDNNNKTGIDPVRGGNLKLSSKEFFENYNKEFLMLYLLIFTLTKMFTMTLFKQ